MYAFRSRKCLHILRLFIVVALLIVAYFQLKSLFYHADTHKLLSNSVDSGSVAHTSPTSHGVDIGIKQSAPNGLTRSGFRQINVADANPSMEDANGSPKNIWKQKKKEYPRGQVDLIQDLVDNAYEEAKTSKFKEDLSSMDPDCNRFTAGAKYNKSKEVVTVILMPHSHNDPGWQWTFDTYHSIRTAQMFDNLVNFLNTVKSDVPFHWSESVSLLKWYKTANEASRDTLKDAIKSQRVLMDHGSWTMPDEASTSVYSLVENLILGHTWINNEFGVKPEYGWSNDPFGHSSTIPYLLKQSGIKAIVINRIDMLLKKELRERQMLEFYWRQLGDADVDADTDVDESADMLTHILPHALYMTQQSFGPNLSLAKTFDFSPVEMLYSEIVNVQTGEVSVEERVIEERARLLSQQIHHRSAYFKHNFLLSPIGDDFRYITYEEFTGVNLNWNYLKQYYEKHPHHKVKLQFGTLADYFKLIDEHVKTNEYPVLSGDFFPYADNSDTKPVDASPSNDKQSPVYWTGYFTTRPFLKIAIRKLETLLRQTEILYSLFKLDMGDAKSTHHLPTTNLSTARETLTWMLHHDAITGTSPTLTIDDFMTHLSPAIADLEKFSYSVAHHFDPEAGSIPVENTASSLIIDTSPHALVLDVRDDKLDAVLLMDSHTTTSFTLYNSLLHSVSTVAHIKLKVPAGLTDFSLVDSSGEPVACQLNPFMDSKFVVVDEYLELSFVSNLPSLGRQSYNLTSSAEGSCHIPIIRVCSDNYIGTFKKFPMLNEKPVNQKYEIDTGLNKVVISPLNGTLIGLKVMGEENVMETKQVFGLYNSGDTDPDLENGLYMFTTVDEGTPLAYKSSLPPLIIAGKVETVVVSPLPFVTQCLRVNAVEAGVSVTQLVDLTTTEGDLFTRIETNVKSNRVFHTDSNSFTMLERNIRYPERPLASNYYPITSSAFIDDDSHRLTLLSAQPLGATSLHEGDIEVMLDRRHKTHDHAGIVEPLLDNRRVVMNFRLLAEKVEEPEVIALTSLALHYSLRSSYPVHAYVGKIASSSGSFSLPCDYHLVNMRSLDTQPYGTARPGDKDCLALVLQRFATVDGKGGLEDHICNKEDEVALRLPPGYIVEKTSLSLLHTHSKVDLASISLDKPNTIQTYRISKQ